MLTTTVATRTTPKPQSRTPPGGAPPTSATSAHDHAEAGQDRRAEQQQHGLDGASATFTTTTQPSCAAAGAARAARARPSAPAPARWRQGHGRSARRARQGRRRTACRRRDRPPARDLLPVPRPSRGTHERAPQRPRGVCDRPRARGRAQGISSGTTEARSRGLRSSEDQAVVVGEGTFVEGLSLGVPSLSDTRGIGGTPARLEPTVGDRTRRARGTRVCDIRPRPPENA